MPCAGICAVGDLAFAQPDSVLLSRLADLPDDASRDRVAHGAVREAAVRMNEEAAARNTLSCLPASERARSYPIRLIIWRRRYMDVRSHDCGKRFEVSVSR